MKIDLLNDGQVDQVSRLTLICLLYDYMSTQSETYLRNEIIAMASDYIKEKTKNDNIREVVDEALNGMEITPKKSILNVITYMSTYETRSHRRIPEEFGIVFKLKNN